MFFLAFLIFAAALYAAGYYVWTVPQQRASRELGVRMRELRANVRSRSAAPSELVRKERRGTFAALGDVMAWLGVLRRLQVYIEQADMKYRAADVAVLTVVLFAGTFLLLSLFGVQLIFLRLLIAFAAAAGPTTYIFRARGRRLKKFEENLPDAIDLFTRTMRAGHNIHSGLETIATETLDPVRQEFKKMMEELALGSQVEPALHNLGTPRAAHRFEVLYHRSDPAAADGREHGGGAGGPGVAGARAPQHGRQAESAYRAAALLRRSALPHAHRGGARLLGAEAGIHQAAVHGSGGEQVFDRTRSFSEIVGILVIRRIANIRV